MPSERLVGIGEQFQRKQLKDKCELHDVNYWISLDVLAALMEGNWILGLYKKHLSGCSCTSDPLISERKSLSFWVRSESTAIRMASTQMSAVVVMLLTTVHLVTAAGKLYQQSCTNVCCLIYYKIFSWICCFFVLASYGPMFFILACGQVVISIALHFLSLQTLILSKMCEFTLCMLWVASCEHVQCPASWYSMREYQLILSWKSHAHTHVIIIIIIIVSFTANIDNET